MEKNSVVMPAVPEIVLQVIAQGREVVPCYSEGGEGNKDRKRPCINNWPENSAATVEKAKIYAELHPGCNWAAVARRDTYLIVDDDGGIMKHWIDLQPDGFDTFTVQTSPGHRQYHFRQTLASQRLGRVEQEQTKDAAFCTRFHNAIGLIFGVHPDGHRYEVVSAAAPVDFPEFLAVYLEALITEKKSAPAVSGPFEIPDPNAPEPATLDEAEAILTHYGWPVLRRTEDKIYTRSYSRPYKASDSIDRTAITIQGTGFHFSTFGTDDNWPDFRKHLDENRGDKPKWNRKMLQTVEGKTENVGVEASVAVPLMVEAPPMIHHPYPLHVWDGTLYSEYARAASQGNYIPQAFHLEALKTATGAVVGNGLYCGQYGVTPRFYTVLLAPGGGGKGTAIDWVNQFYKEIASGSDHAPLIWGSNVELFYKIIGAAGVSFGSDVGMQNATKKQPRWLQQYEEISTLFERVGIQGSGQSLLAANRQLFDTENFTVMETSKRAGFSGRALNSILGATTPELWADMFAGAQAHGSGIFQRLCIVAYDGKIKRVARLRYPDVRAIRSALVNKILLLEHNPIDFTISPAAAELLDFWFDTTKYQDGDPEDTGRLNIIAQRNALHLAWLRETSVIGEVEMKGGIALADHQFEMRQIYRPNDGKNPNAVLEGKITSALSKGPLKKWDLFRNINYKRHGSENVIRVIKGMVGLGSVAWDAQNGFYTSVLGPL